MISCLLAMDENQLIGRNNTLPWHLPDDLRYFKKITLGHPVIMGKNTFISIGKPLPERQNIVLTHHPEQFTDEVSCFGSVDEFLESRLSFGKECFVIGGAKVFQAFLPYTDRLYITHIRASFEGDTYFSGFHSEEWRLVSSIPGKLDQKNHYPHSFCIYERV
ncbi:dihydrofolate reductase [Sporolactobacillus kofuensis]|uniref:Dihydrofolate reductase n=1 Tax=Sporolactobacillus kofuensis TaxID=269672 RepID=A0ABW1WIB6_9BACL|nr:dihydrofolate reductase [Sporolactobacillus kofuensis]MCO7176246.1 dihydrofolate reductase [Sporolactobacillus kofuensis]